MVAVVGVVATTIAVATIWLLLTNPVQVADQVSHGDVGQLAQAVGVVILQALQGLFKYL